MSSLRDNLKNHVALFYQNITDQINHQPSLSYGLPPAAEGGIHHPSLPYGLPPAAAQRHRKAVKLIIAI